MIEDILLHFSMFTSVSTEPLWRATHLAPVELQNIILIWSIHCSSSLSVTGTQIKCSTICKCCLTQSSYACPHFFCQLVSPNILLNYHHFPTPTYSYLWSYGVPGPSMQSWAGLPQPNSSQKRNTTQEICYSCDAALEENCSTKS